MRYNAFISFGPSAAAWGCNAAAAAAKREEAAMGAFASPPFLPFGGAGVEALEECDALRVMDRDDLASWEDALGGPFFVFCTLLFVFFPACRADKASGEGRDGAEVWEQDRMPVLDRLDEKGDGGGRGVGPPRPEEVVGGTPRGDTFLGGVEEAVQRRGPAGRSVAFVRSSFSLDVFARWAEEWSWREEEEEEEEEERRDFSFFPF